MRQERKWPWGVMVCFCILSLVSHKLSILENQHLKKHMGHFLSSQVRGLISRCCLTDLPLQPDRGPSLHRSVPPCSPARGPSLHRSVPTCSPAGAPLSTGLCPPTAQLGPSLPGVLDRTCSLLSHGEKEGLLTKEREVGLESASPDYSGPEELPAVWRVSKHTHWGRARWGTQHVP